MVLETTKERYKTRTGDSEFKCFHWWEAVKHQPKWRAKFANSSIIDSWVSSSDRMGEDEVTDPMGRDRDKAVTRKGKGKGKGKGGSSSESRNEWHDVHSEEVKHLIC
jgi:hypothetical protein